MRFGPPKVKYLKPAQAGTRALPEVEEAHVIAGPASLLVKIRVGTPEQLQASLRRLFEVEGVTGTQTVVVLESFFERPLDPHPPAA
ncbi:Lrp/AsnC ligand binding domain-containing protein [Micromonospora sp. NPDC006766]|uniref:Lrp/AsnC ligand binding domain-containing protein n=1 Tax=Micromonospora sp. NPDC006766 TaxID=3154778 RepID=UPI0033E5FAD1